MSYDIYLENECGETFELDLPHTEGGTYVLGGCTETELNVTYNYGGKFDFRALHGRTGKDTIPDFETAISILSQGPDDSKDYWEPTDGNVMRACGCLLAFALQHPNGIWRVS